jgi:hypothetical protein
MVASIYKPFSVKALGGLFFPLQLEVEIFDFKIFHSSRFREIIYPLGNLSELDVVYILPI